MHPIIRHWLELEATVSVPTRNLVVLGAEAAVVPKLLLKVASLVSAF